MSQSKQKAPGRIKSGILKWLGVPISLTDGSFWSAWGGLESSSGETVTVDSAMQLSAAWACVRLIAETVATLPLNLHQKGADGTRSLAISHQLYEVLHNQPNADNTAVEFWEVIVASMLLWGNGYARKLRSAGTIIGLELMLPQRMTVKRLTTGALQYTYRDIDGSGLVLTEDDVLHFRGFSLNGWMGVSVIAYAREVFGNAIAANKTSSSVFKNGLRPSGVLSTDQVLQKDKREEIRGSLAAQFGGAMQAGKTMVLEAGMKYQAITMNPGDVQLLETKAFNVEEICRWFRVPPFMVGHSEKSTSWGTGIEQQMIGFLTFALRPWLTRIEQAIRRGCLTPQERTKYFAQFSVEGLLRADSAGRASFYSTMTQNGIMTRDECRAKENLPPMDGNAAVLTVQSALLPIDKLGERTAAAAAQDALKAWLSQEEKTHAAQEQ
ncbi:MULTISPECIES: phage portal protein [pseudomallei group]|uniref:Phage portal protein, HK97 family n=1 Tax=Burkholderia oklahomensis TaxID=342113 RepID=A0AAI8FP41_9BURK|nr:MULTISPECIES: phage portal protein [pseudomallei group]UCR75731.1 protal protein [Burkholderia phage phiBt-TXDOH]AIO68236.1 phage portal protein, HK97 family [Burkholderia oklahomensis]AIP67058.1 portal protein [Burkholderia thailandensis]AOI42580.1 portal protein [Burkholderia oklahomensis EO147]AOI55490.1 portal protein [Burkholderia thailandensis]